VTKTNQSLGRRAILVAPDDAQARELTAELLRHGARVLAWPQIEIVEPDSYSGLDEAIHNLFGYDWLIFANVNAASFFLRRLQHLEHEISELDAPRVCALDDATRQQLEESHVHVDLVPEKLAIEGVIAALETYNGGRDSLRGLNFLLPRAAISRDHLPQALEDAGARVDVLADYRTASNNSELIQLNALVAGGGIDCIVFTSPSSVRALSQLFDTNDLSRLLKGVVVACVDRATAQVATEFGLPAQITPTEFTIPELAHSIASYFP
jgi:uroporphyrinogen III methyltransferase/synthase